jgi:hypothetical protein
MLAFSVIAVPLMLAATGFGVAATLLTAGAVLSTLISTGAEVDDNPALLVAEHVYVNPVVSVLIKTAVQPVLDDMPDTASTVDHVSATSLVYHPPLPDVPLTDGRITGAVLSIFKLVTLAVALVLPALSVHTPDPPRFVPSEERIVGLVQLAIPDNKSYPENIRVTLLTYH